MSGKTQVSYNGIFGISTVYKNLKMLSADDFRRVASERGISILDKGNNTDFQKEIEQTGLQQNHHIAFYGGSNESSYRVSLGFMDRQGVILNEDMKNFTSNMNMTQRMFDGFLNCELGMFGSIQKNHNLVDLQKTFYSAATFNPTYPNHKDPDSGSWDGITTASQITNPLAWMEVQDHDATSHISTHARLTFNLMDELKLVLFGAYTYNIVENSQYLPTSVWAHGQAYKGTKKMESLLGNMMLTYKKGWKKHYFDALALAELQKETYTGFYTTVTNFNTDKFGYHNLQAGALRPWEGTNSYYEQPHLASFMGRFNYTYADRYSLTMTARTDASSKFGANHKWGFFPSVSAAWVISEEKFMKRLPVIDNLKFRIGYGLAGNQSGIDSYTTLSLVKPNGVIPVGNSAAVSLGDLRNTNPDLKWEVKHTFNTGIDLAMFGNRLLLSANYYNSKTTDMLYLYNVSVPPFTYNTLLANIGSMRNSGLEIAIGITPLKTQDMELNINANITFQQNKLLSLSGMYNGELISAPEYKSLASLDGAGFHGGYNHIVYQVVGQPLGVFYLPRANGLVSDGNGGYTYDIADLNGQPRRWRRPLCSRASRTQNDSRIEPQFPLQAFRYFSTDQRRLRTQNIQRNLPDLYEHEYIPRLQCDAGSSRTQYQRPDRHRLLAGKRSVCQFRLRDTRLERTDRKGAETKEICPLPATGIYSQQPCDDFRLFRSFAHDQQLDGQLHFGAGR